MEELAAAAAMARCLMPRRLRGPEIKAIRKILDMTARELSEAMGESTAVETISRWENEKEIPGGYAEKLLRLAVCERLKEKAPGVDYDPERLIRTKLMGNGKLSREDVPPILFKRMPVRQDHRVNDSWTEGRRAA